MKLKTKSFDSLLNKELKNKDFKKEYEVLSNEFTLAKEIIKLRKKRNLTQKDLAEKIGTSQPAIARIESGNYKNLSLSLINRLAKALDAEPVIHLKSKNA
ncbi:helix-turn-helix domain-containing protein [Leptospira interrogans]|uniref:Helix-turn-helix transcriptional regulator n=5 Tax=Leptospira interrogans TaxID=173 RepID=A0AAV9FU60_LEPIR|nr:MULTISPECIES: helix-turn-helix transcriptional regulator [Leptospira]ALE40606.1 DNA-binding protein [Leptospira interrogans serovar Hardjo str. Norma]ALN99694.1 XRE family transcriptional regulator [Leptospira interrogans serovar Hardjo-prajitno]ASV05532.1 XRE family transcriptional regulator [Leptospira interrogans serovar Canicola]EJO80078.1 DNA-binding helix-turn-helix protein [Leptospira interrogans serovar Pomona str. Kennewicki LC82-25]EJP04219.1 DNA-binding helix-turn-helix protein [